MTKLLILGLVLALFVPIAGLPQTPAPAAPAKPDAAAKPDPQAESKAFNDAGREKDPIRKLQLFEAFLKSYPNGGSANSARQEIIETEFARNPAVAEARMKRFEKEIGPFRAAPGWRLLASEYLKSGKDFPKAEKAAKRALKPHNFQAYLADAKREAEATKRPMFSQGRLESSFNSSRISMLETLGEAYTRQGKDKQAEAPLREAIGLNISAGRAATALAGVLERQGKKQDALTFAAQGALARPSRESREKFDALFLAVNGSSEGSEKYLDERYQGLFPAPIHAEPYQKSAQRSNRLVLLEVYTGAGCPPCVAPDLAFDAALERYPRNDVAVIMFHQHIPRPDPLSNDATRARWKWYEGRGVPSYSFDGESSGGGGPREFAAEFDKKTREAIDKRLVVPASASVQLAATHQGSSVLVRAGAGDLKKESPDLTLHIVLVEKLIRYSGENGIRFHPMIVRSHVSFELKTAKSTSEEHVFDLAQVAATLKNHLDEFEKFDERHNKDGKFRFMARPETIDPANLAVVAWVQDMKTREVFQAAWADAPAAGVSAAPSASIH